MAALIDLMMRVNAPDNRWLDRPAAEAIAAELLANPDVVLRALGGSNILPVFTDYVNGTNEVTHTYWKVPK